VPGGMELTGRHCFCEHFPHCFLRVMSAGRQTAKQRLAGIEQVWWYGHQHGASWLFCMFARKTNLVTELNNVTNPPHTLCH
jgi:hypothetical protein